MSPMCSRAVSDSSGKGAADTAVSSQKVRDVLRTFVLTRFDVSDLCAKNSSICKKDTAPTFLFRNAHF